MGVYSDRTHRRKLRSALQVRPKRFIFGTAREGRRDSEQRRITENRSARGIKSKIDPRALRSFLRLQIDRGRFGFAALALSRLIEAGKE